MLNVFRDISLAQLNAMFLYEMSKLLREETIERVNFMNLLFTAYVRSLCVLIMGCQSAVLR